HSFHRLAGTPGATDGDGVRTDARQRLLVLAGQQSHGRQGRVLNGAELITIKFPLKYIMAKQTRGELVIIGFDYAPLEASVAEQVRSAAERIREKVQRTLADLIEVGDDLLAVKEAVGHGRFGAWLRAEFGWTERTARHLMAVAERFGPRSEMISDLR